MPVYQTDDYTNLQIKERNFIDKFKPKFNKTWIVHTHTQTEIKTHTHTHTHIYIYIYIYTLRKTTKTVT